MSDSALPDFASIDDANLLGNFSEAQREQFTRYVDELLLANQSFNLTAIRDRDDAWTRHIEESVRLVPFVGGAKRLIDIGSGGGLPGMALAIARPDVEVTLLEATTKKARFLESTGAKLGLFNLRVVCERAEVAARSGAELREAFDMVSARAVAPLPTLLELTIPFLRVGGVLLSVKGMKADEEMRAAERAQKLLFTELSEQIRHPSATLLLFKKTAKTPSKYPRRSGEPKHNPL
jgi:16S rRNA (guanine527-N7)-methyltransferase